MGRHPSFALPGLVGMTPSFEFDPAEVLAVSPSASLEEIREAYRAKSRKHHPDAGGDEWAFRLVVRSYEMLSQARVAAYFVDEEEERRPSAARPRPAAGKQGEAGFSVRRGVRDEVAHPSLLVDVESLILRHELENPYELLSVSSQERNLSCSLSVRWPGEHGGWGSERMPLASQEIVGRISAAFSKVVEALDAGSVWREELGEEFNGLLGFQTARETSEAAMRLRAELKARGLGLVHWTREIVLPREEDSTGSR